MNVFSLHTGNWAIQKKTTTTTRRHRVLKLWAMFSYFVLDTDSVRTRLRIFWCDKPFDEEMCCDLFYLPMSAISILDIHIPVGIVGVDFAVPFQWKFYIFTVLLFFFLSWFCFCRCCCCSRRRRFRTPHWRYMCFFYWNALLMPWMKWSSLKRQTSNIHVDVNA